MPELRTTHQRRRALKNCFDDDYAGKICVFVILLLVAMGGMSMYYSSEVVQEDDKYSWHQLEYELFFNGLESAQDRKETAESFMQIDAVGGYAQVGLREQDLPAFERVAETGEPLDLQIISTDWNEFWSVYMLRMVFPAWLLVVSTFSFIRYWYQDDDYDKYYLMDLRWNKPGAYVFVLLTPIGWPFYAVSAVRVRRAKRAALLFDEQAEQDGEEAQAETPEVVRHEDYVFYSDPKAAYGLYVELRTGGAERMVQRQKAELADEIDEIRGQLNAVANSMRELQSDLNAATAKKRELDAIHDAEIESETESKAQYEFASLMRLKGVTRVRVVNDHLSILLKARITYDGVRYDLGDWDIRLSPGYDRLITMELRSGVRRGWDDGYPVYRLSTTEFCFGSRANDIAENLRKGQYLQAIEIAVDSMQSVNEKHLELIPRAFRKAKT